MTKTKTKKAIALAWILAISATNFSNTFADIQIGTGSVTGSWAFDTSIMWDETFTDESASGSISGIEVTARVLPTLTMEISKSAINLGDLVAGVTSTGWLFIEIGTNAKSGVSITARSWSGWLTNTSDNSIKINNEDSDGESYKFNSNTNTTNDSSSWDFEATWLISTEVNENTTEHTIYSSNKPESTDGINDVEFVVSAESTAETPAWEYEDTITFTVTGNF